MSTGPRVSGPHVVAIGGGHGLAATLRAANRYAGTLCGIVSVADDGGSSGRLRHSLGESVPLPAPGDVRRCLAALAGDSTLFGRVFDARFTAGELAGHALGNLVLAGLVAASGDFLTAVEEASRLLGLPPQRRVLPATTVPVTLRAETATGSVEGQVAVSSSTGITGVGLQPADAPAPAAAVEAIAAADQVVVGPGSLYTSVLAALAVPGIGAAVETSRATTVYICNLNPQIPETEGYDAARHVEALAAHGVEVDVVLCHPGALPLGSIDVPVVERPVARPSGLAHDPDRLAEALADLM